MPHGNNNRLIRQVLYKFLMSLSGTLKKFFSLKPVAKFSPRLSFFNALVIYFTGFPADLFFTWFMP